MEDDPKIIKFEDLQDSSRSTTVEKLIEVQLDLGRLLASDTNDLDPQSIKSNKEDYFKDLARDNAQLIINALWQLPTEKVEDSVVAKLPKPTYILPREKRLPVPKPPTRWEQYAKLKGIRTTKKANLDWDEVLKKWVPRYGYKKSAAEREKDWVIEVPDSVDPYTDMFEKKAEKKSEKISKNEFQRLRNIAKSKKVKVPSMGLPPTTKMTSLQLNSAANIANFSTASVGKFQPKLSAEKQLTKASVLQQKKRKLPPLTKKEEKNRNLSIAESLLNKKPKLDLNKAVNREINAQETESHDRKGEGKRKGRGGKKGKKVRGGGGDKKPKAGKGNRQFPKSRQGGRKRR